jgi:hypothetical protein
MRAWLCVVVLLAGCERLLSLGPVQRTDGGGSGHVPMVDADPRPPAPDSVAGDAAPDAQLIPGCPVSYTGIMHGAATGYYRFMLGESATWAAAEHACELQGQGYAMATHLAVFADDQEASAAQAIHNGLKAWIGLSSIGHTGFNWVTDEDTMGYPFTPGESWEGGTPTNGTSVDCVEFAGDAKFTNLNCAASLPYVCECDTSKADPTNF